MQSVEEYPSNVHFFKLLFQLAAQNQVTLKVPDTFISGFAFSHPVFMTFSTTGLRFTQVLDFPHMLDEMHQYEDTVRSVLPRYVVKRRQGKDWLYTKQQAVQTWERLHGKEDFVLQPFLVSPGSTARLVRVTWTQLRGTKAILLSSPCPYLKPKENAQKSVRFSDITSTESMDTDEKYLQITDTALETECNISQTTEHLAATVEYVRLILEKTVLQGFSARISSITIDVLPDIHGKFYFLCIDSYQLGRLKKYPSVEPTSARSLPSQLTKRRTKDLSESQSPLLPFRDLRLKQKSTNIQSKLKNNLSQKLTRAATAESSSLSSRWTKTLELEDAISSLIQQKAYRPISHMTYRKWRERTEDGQVRNLDLLYAQKLASKASEVQVESDSRLKDLVTMKSEMLAITAVSALRPDTLTKEIGRNLLERAKLAKEVQSKPLINLPRCHSNPALDKYRNMKMMQLGRDRAQDTLNQVARRMDALQKTTSKRRLL